MCPRDAHRIRFDPATGNNPHGPAIAGQRHSYSLIGHLQMDALLGPKTSQIESSVLSRISCW